MRLLFCSGNFVPLPPKLIPYVNLRNRDIGGRNPRLFRVGTIQRVLGHAEEPLVMGVVRNLAVHYAAFRADRHSSAVQTR